MSSIERPTHSEDVGTFNNIAYVRHRGQFRGMTVAGGTYSVPYEITVPKNPAEGKQLFVFEPPHLMSGLVARDSLFGEQFFFGSGYSHASCGFGFRGRHILNPTPGFELKIRGHSITEIPPDPDEEVMDLNIIHQFVLELRRSRSDLFGEVHRVYATGASESGKTIHDIYNKFGHRVFDLTVACTAEYFPPRNIKDQSPIMVVNTEADFDRRAMPNRNFPAYRYYNFSGGPHIPDSVLTRAVFTGQGPPAIAGTSPINWLLFARALFKSGDQWIRNGNQPPPNATFKLDSNGEILRDDMLNALGGIRHPASELREARFIASVDRNGWDLFGDYRNPRQITDGEFPGYLRSFTKATDALRDAGYLLPQGHARLIREVQLSPPNTYTLNYRAGLLFRN